MVFEDSENLSSSLNKIDEETCLYPIDSEALVNAAAEHGRTCRVKPRTSSTTTTVSSPQYLGARRELDGAFAREEESFEAENYLPLRHAGADCYVDLQNGVFGSFESGSKNSGF